MLLGQTEGLAPRGLDRFTPGGRGISPGGRRGLGPLLQVTNSISVAPNGNTFVTATCPAGTTVISGGGLPSTYADYLVGSVRNGNGWTAYVHSTSGATTTLTAYAYCLVGGSSN